MFEKKGGGEGSSLVPRPMHKSLGTRLRGRKHGEGRTRIREGKERAGESRRCRCYYFLIELSILESEKEKRAEKLSRMYTIPSTLIEVSIITLIAVSH